MRSRVRRERPAAETQSRRELCQEKAGWKGRLQDFMIAIAPPSPEGILTSALSTEGTLTNGHLTA
jgi:hypothetical protein